MHGNKGDQKKSDRVVQGGGRFNIKQLDPNKVDDFRERIKCEEEKRKQNWSGGQGSSQNHN